MRSKMASSLGAASGSASAARGASVGPARPGLVAEGVSALPELQSGVAAVEASRGAASHSLAPRDSNATIPAPSRRRWKVVMSTVLARCAVVGDGAQRRGVQSVDHRKHSAIRRMPSSRRTAGGRPSCPASRRQGGDRPATPRGAVGAEPVTYRSQAMVQGFDEVQDGLPAQVPSSSTAMETSAVMLGGWQAAGAIACLPRRLQRSAAGAASAEGSRLRARRRRALCRRTSQPGEPFSPRASWTASLAVDDGFRSGGPAWGEESWRRGQPRVDPRPQPSGRIPGRSTPAGPESHWSAPPPPARRRR